MALLLERLHSGETESDRDGSGNKFGDMTVSEKCWQLKATDVFLVQEYTPSCCS